MTRIPLRRATSITLSSARKPSSLNSPGRRTWTHSPMSEPSRYTLRTYVRTTWPPIWRTDSSASSISKSFGQRHGFGRVNSYASSMTIRFGMLNEMKRILAIAVEKFIAATGEEVFQVLRCGRCRRRKRQRGGDQCDESKKMKFAIHRHTASADSAGWQFIVPIQFDENARHDE